MINIVIFAFIGIKKPFTPILDKLLDKTYRTFSLMGKRFGCKILLARPNEYEKGRLKSAWIFDKKWKKVRNQRIDFIYNMTLYIESQKYMKKITKGFKTMNHPDVIRIMTDKYETYKHFKKYMPKTFVIRNKAHMRKIIKRNLGRIIVLKPRYGLQGIGVHTGLINKMPKIKKLKNDYIFQEFIDTRKSNDIIKGVHDIRLYVINGKIVYHYSRVPKQGLLTNVARGGHVINYPKSKIPKQILAIKKVIEKKFKKYKPRIYAADFMIDNSGKAWILELNGFPGIDMVEGEPKTIRYPMYRAIFNAIKKA